MVDKILKCERVTSPELPTVDPTTTATSLDDRTLQINFVRNKLENFQVAIVQDVDKRMSGLIDEVIAEMRQHALQMHEFRNFAKSPTQHEQQQQHAHVNNTWNNRTIASETSNARKNTSSSTEATDKQPTATDYESSSAQQPLHQKKTSKRRTLPDKIFVTRESYLTALLEVDHMKTIYHIFYVILLVFLMNSIFYDYFVEGRVSFGLGTFKSGMARIHWVFGVWLLQHVFIFSLYYAFKGWALVRTKLAQQPCLQRFWTNSCLITYISSQLLFGYVASVLCLKMNLPFVSACVLLLESTRLLMKMHAFIRTNAARVVVGKLKSEAPQTQTSKLVPPFGSYLYFLFAPTLIYRDNYPRTHKIRIKFAVNRLLEVVAIAFLYSYIHERYIRVHFVNYGLEDINAAALIMKLFGMLMPSVIIFLCGFYLILHSWLNFTSELLRFGDRMFYKDWWTSHTYDAYYRNWNVVVHDWLYEYIYKDFYMHIFKGSKVGASLMVFMISALVHEQVLGFALQLFFPVMFVFFGVVGVSLVFIMRRAPKTLGNIFLWFTLIFGNGAMISLYSMEYYARQNCPVNSDNWLERLVPAIWSCYN